MPVVHVDLGWCRVIFPVGDTISDHHAFEVGLEDCRVAHVRLVPGVNSIDQIRNIDAGIGLARDVQLMLLELREQFEPANDGLDVIVRNVVVIENALICNIRITVRVADASWLLDVQHVCLSVPAV